MLTFNNHIASMCKKAARELAVLKRIGHLLTIKGKIEKIQERALRFIYGPFSQKGTNNGKDMAINF